MAEQDPKDQPLPHEIVTRRPRPPARRRKWWPWWVVAFASLGALGVFLTLGVDLPAPGMPQPSDVGIPSIEQTATNQAPDLNTQVAALGRLEPLGKVRDVAPPSTSTDAPILEMRAVAGDVVTVGETLAILGSAPRIEAQLRRAEAELALQMAELERTRDTLRLEQLNAAAALRISEAQLAEAERVLTRQERLSGGGSASQAVLDAARTDRSVLAAELEQAQARLARVAGDLDVHPDVRFAQQSVERARADVAISEVDSVQTRVTAPIGGVVLSILSEQGERPASDGILRLADTSVMVVRMEVHQNRIHRVALGQRVTILGDALPEPLSGEVTLIGLEVLDQGLIGTDPVVANNARVFEVTATLDEVSTAIASQLINLQVLVTIEVGE